MFSVSMLIFISVLCVLLSYIFSFLLVHYTELHLRLVYCRGTCTYFEGHRGTQEVELLVQLLTFCKIPFVLFCNQFRNVLISERHLSVRTCTIILTVHNLPKEKYPRFSENIFTDTQHLAN